MFGLLKNKLSAFSDKLKQTINTKPEAAEAIAKEESKQEEKAKPAVKETPKEIPKQETKKEEKTDSKQSKPETKEEIKVTSKEEPKKIEMKKEDKPKKKTKEEIAEELERKLFAEIESEIVKETKPTQKKEVESEEDLRAEEEAVEEAEEEIEEQEEKISKREEKEAKKEIIEEISEKAKEAREEKKAVPAKKEEVKVEEPKKKKGLLDFVFGRKKEEPKKEEVKHEEKKEEIKAEPKKKEKDLREVSKKEEIFIPVKETEEVVEEVQKTEESKANEEELEEIEEQLEEETTKQDEKKANEEEYKERLEEKRKQLEDFEIKGAEEDKRELKASVGTGGKLKGMLFGGVEISEKDIADLLDELELSLIESDVEQDAAMEIVKQIKQSLVGKKVSAKNLDAYLNDEIKRILTEMMTTEEINVLEAVKSKAQKPYRILMLGPNGAGKTTSIAKLTKYFEKNNLSVILAAGDTFRAAAIDQLEEHAKRLGVRVVKQQYGADPAAVAFDAIKAAEAGKIDVVIIDSAGRQETNKNLMEELKKIERVAKPDLKIYVGESYAGQGLLDQASEFNDAVGIDGFILTKIDTDAKGGTTISLLYKLKKPVLFVGTGQEYTGLQEFTPEFILNRII